MRKRKQARTSDNAPTDQLQKRTPATAAKQKVKPLRSTADPKTKKLDPITKTDDSD